jgi:excisionase family DNA binding protein
VTKRAYTVASLAGEWECSEGVIRKLIADGRLAHFRVGILIRIPAEEVRRFECQNIPSNDSAAASQSSIETQQDDDIESAYEPPIALGLKRRLGAGGRQGATVHRGPWAQS